MELNGRDYKAYKVLGILGRSCFWVGWMGFFGESLSEYPQERLPVSLEGEGLCQSNIHLDPPSLSLVVVTQPVTTQPVTDGQHSLIGSRTSK